MRITSPANPRLKHAVRLQDSRFRRRHQQFLVDGVREIGRALLAGFTLQALFVRVDSNEAAPATEELLARLIDQADVPQPPPPLQQLCDAIESATLEVPANLFAKLTYGQRKGDFVAQFAAPALHLDTLQLPPQPLIVVLDRLEKPGNIGAIIRSADAAGANAVLLSDCAGDLFHPNVIRASSGAVFFLPVRSVSSSDLLPWLRGNQFRMLATRVDAAETLWSTDWNGSVALLVGNEAEGLGAAWRAEDIEPVRIPMGGVGDSLNASVCTAICLFEAVRQRISSPRLT